MITERAADPPGTVAPRHGPRLHGWRMPEGIGQEDRMTVHTYSIARDALLGRLRAVRDEVDA